MTTRGLVHVKLLASIAVAAFAWLLLISDAVIVQALIVGGALLTVIVGNVFTLLNQRAMKAKLDDARALGDQIHAAVNSTASLMTADLKAKNEKLEEQAGELTALRAQMAAAKQTVEIGRMVAEAIASAKAAPSR